MAEQGEDGGWVAEELRVGGGRRGETAKCGELGRGEELGPGARRARIPSLSASVEGWGRLRSRLGQAREVAGLGDLCRGWGWRTLQSGKPLLHVGLERAEKRRGGAKGTEFRARVPGGRGRRPGSLLLGSQSAGTGLGGEGGEEAGEGGYGRVPTGPGGRGSGERSQPVSGGLLFGDEESQLPYKFQNALTGAQS